MRRQFAGILSSRGLGSVLQAIALVLLARRASTADFGVVSVVTATVGMALVLTGMGLAIYVPQVRARGEHHLVAGALRVNSWSSLVSVVVLSAAVAWWLQVRGGPYGTVLIAVSLTLERNVETHLGVSLGDGDSRTTAVSILLRRVVSLFVFAVGLLVGAEPVWAYCAGLLVGAVVAQVHVRRAVSKQVRDVGGLSAGDVRSGEVVRRSSAYLLANVSAQLRTLDVTVVAAVLPTTAAGLYAAASKLVQPLLLVPQSIAAVVAPRSTRMTGADARALAGRLALLFGAALVLGLPAIIWAEPLIVFIMGPGFEGAGVALAWSLAGLPLLAISSTYVAILQGQGRARAAAVNAAVFGGLLLCFVAVGAARWGIGGAAAGLTASYLLRVGALAMMVSRLGDDSKRESVSNG